MKKKTIDYPLLITFILLVIIGLFMVYSASNVVANYKYDDSFYFLKRELLFTLLGSFLMYIIIKIDINKILKHTTLIFLISLIFLILVLIPGIGVLRGGARSWIGFGSFSFQPAEFIKLTVVLVLAKYLSKNANDLNKFRYFLGILFIIFLIFGLIMLQPDFGTGIVLVLSCLLLLFLSGAPFKYFILLLIIGLIGVTILIVSAPYRLERIMAFLDPWSDPLGSGFQTIQSLYAISPSGIFGLGYNKSMQKHFFLPEPQNDFIFAIICEEMGLIGGLIVIFLFGFLIYRIFKIAINQKSEHYKYICFGIGLIFFTQVFINLGVVTGLLPVTGVTLPIISYGGSSLVLSMVMIGLVLNISSYQELM